MDDLNKLLDDVIIKERDRLRPELKLVIDVLEGLFAEMKSEDITPMPELRGPDSWGWTRRDPAGFDQSFIVSTAPTAPGHPLLTIRQGIAPKLEHYVTTCGLILGLDPDMIERAVTQSLVRHDGAVAGLKSTLLAMGQEGNIGHGLDRVYEIMEGFADDLKNEVSAFDEVHAPKGPLN